MRSWFLSWPALSLLSSLAIACGGSAETETAGGPSGGRGTGTPAVPVTVTRVAKKAVPLEVQVIGAVEPSSSVAIRAQITGELTSVQFTEGDDVKQGEVLFTLDRRPLEAAMKQAEANLERDQAQAANAVSQAKRYEDLAARGIATREQVDTSATNATALQATVGADRAAVDNARIQLNYSTITAPVTGRTGALMVHPGNLVRANDTTPLVVINQVSPVNVVFAIPEAQLPDLAKVHGAENRSRRSADAWRRGQSVRGSHHLRGQRGRSDDRHHQGQGLLSQRASAPLARSVRQRRRDVDR